MRWPKRRLSDALLLGKRNIQENVAKLGKWVQQKPPDPPTATQVDGPLLPEDKARQGAAAWHTHWNPDHLPHLDQVQNFCLQLNNQVDPVTPESIQVVGADLARSALKAKQKAAGMDAWSPFGITLQFCGRRACSVRMFLQCGKIFA